MKRIRAKPLQLSQDGKVIQLPGLTQESSSRDSGEDLGKERIPAPCPRLQPTEHSTNRFNVLQVWFQRLHSLPSMVQQTQVPTFFLQKFIELFLMLFQKKKNSKFR